MAPTALASAGRRCHGTILRRGVLCAAAAFLAGVQKQCLFAGPASRAAHPVAAGRRGAAVVRQAGDRKAYIAVVDVDVTRGDEQTFLAASLENARSSVNEDNNKRFDVLQSQDEPSRFALVEIYGNEKGPIEHKGTEHYNTWRETVADLMASPRSATQWDTIFPEDASKFAADAIILERLEPDYLDVTHVFADVAPGSEDAFIQSTVRMAKKTFTEDGLMRFDVLRNVEDSTKFLMIEVFRTPEDGVLHQRSDHFARWRDEVASMMSSPRTSKKYVNHFPNLPAGWKVDRSIA